MKDPVVTAVNAQLAALNWFDDLAENAANIYTPGYREKRFLFSDYINGALYQDDTYKEFQGKALPGRSPSNLFIEGKGMFVVRKQDGNFVYTRLGDFKYDGNGTLVNELGYKVQGYLTDEKGNIVNTGAVQANPNGSPNNPSHNSGGPGHIPTTEISLWTDPTNGKFFGKYDEFKVKADGTIVGMADGGKTIVPLYKIALVSFASPENLYQQDNFYYTPTAMSGDPVEGTGEIQSGLIEKSNVGLRETANYLQLAKTQLDITSKLINTNKTLLQESLRLIQ
jgi:flagellar hook protein FlgE